MNVIPYNDGEKFLTLVMPLLQVDEARNNLILGVCLSIRDYVRPEGPLPYLACVWDGEVIVLVGVIDFHPSNCFCSAR